MCVRLHACLRAALIKTQNVFACKIFQHSNALWVQKLSGCTIHGSVLNWWLLNNSICGSIHDSVLNWWLLNNSICGSIHDSVLNCWLLNNSICGNRRANSTKVYSRSVDPRKLRIYRRKILRSTFLHTSKSHAAPGMHAYSTRELCAKMHMATSALLLFTLNFLSWWSSQSNQNKLKYVNLLHAANTAPREGLRHMLGVF